MPRLSSGGAKRRLATASALVLLATTASWLAFREPAVPVVRDFEECAEQAKSLSDDERNAALTDCNARFAGRRKAGGGYTYFDFMQNRNFDIAAPNPTPEELRQIDRAYMDFLDGRRREALAVESAKRQDEQSSVELQKAPQPVGPPMVLTPASPKAAPVKRSIE
jgi:hypothetical protein